ncbi:hypothetical protein GCM10010252_18280 [Streptomyces aureoverticillatus]|nr:hypothetical protein GCM10010252_18280 [Streptomyces aureoverticillatus]
MQLHHLTRRLDDAPPGPPRARPTGSPRDQQEGSQRPPTARTGVRAPPTQPAPPGPRRPLAGHGHKKIALDPAESSAINDAPKWHRRGARWGGSRVVCSYMSDVTARLGDPAAVVLIVRCVLLAAA